MATSAEQAFRGEIEVEREDLIHNDLGNTAHYLATRVATRLAAGDHDAIFLEMLAALIMTALTLEANVNYVGDALKPTNWKKIQGGAGTRVKLSLLCETIGLKIDWSVRPYSTVESLVKLRNILAHGKPRREIIREEAVGTSSELMRRARALQEAGWAETVTPDFVAIAYADVDDIWQELLCAAKIDIVETLSGGSASVSYLGPASS